MKFQQFSFGQLRIDAIEDGYDVVIDRGKVGETEEESFQEVPRSLRSHAAHFGREDTVEVSPLGGRHGRRSAASYGSGQT